MIKSYPNLAETKKKYLNKFLKGGAVLFNRLTKSDVFGKYTKQYEGNTQITGNINNV
jgi:hypothetical protein